MIIPFCPDIDVYVLNRQIQCSFPHPLFQKEETQSPPFVKPVLSPSKEGPRGSTGLTTGSARGDLFSSGYERGPCAARGDLFLW
jgi:hypothetical protein